MASAGSPCEKKFCLGSKWMSFRPTPASSRKAARSKVIYLTSTLCMARPGCGLHGSSSEGYAAASDLSSLGIRHAFPAVQNCTPSNSIGGSFAFGQLGDSGAKFARRNGAKNCGGKCGECGGIWGESPQ